LILWPTAIKALKSQKEMREIQPLVEEVKQKYGKEEQAQKLMELYKEHKINPLGSCLLMLIQLPIIMVLYQVFRNGLTTAGFSTLYSFMPHPGVIDTHFLGLNLSTPDKWILPIITGLLQLVQTKQMQALTRPMTNAKTDDSQAAMMVAMNKNMLYLTPVMTVLFSMRLPAALPLYWLMNTLFAIVQQWWFFKNHPIKMKGSPENKKSVTDEGKSEKKIEKKGKKENSIIKKKDVTVTVRRKGE
jgi:YidC/Oxa1 family membrane protein insertase